MFYRIEAAGASHLTGFLGVPEFLNAASRFFRSDCGIFNTCVFHDSVFPLWTSSRTAVENVGETRMRAALTSLATSLGFIAAVAASSANAADIPMPVKGVAPAPAYYNWTGVYVGAHGGYGWARFSGIDPATGATDAVTAKGFFGGGQLGANYQAGSWVFGLEGALSFGDIKYREDFGGGDFGQIKVDQMASVAARIGYAFDRFMIYGKAGGAWTREKWDFAVLGGTANATVNRTGWLAGAGFEYAFATNWSAFLDYEYRDMGNKTVTLTTTGGLTADSPSVKLNVQTVKAGVNWRFWGPY